MTSGVNGDGRQAPTGSPDAIGHALTDVTEKVQQLVREEVELAKAEVGAKAAKLGRGVAIGAAAGTFVLGALVLILHGFAWLAWYLIFPDNQFFWGFFLVAFLLLVIAAVAGLVAYRAVKAGSPPTPQMAIDEAKLIRETVSAKHPGTTVDHPEVRP
jgi:Putative Actinobacterial Holin-X, holin superfamily III